MPSTSQKHGWLPRNGASEKGKKREEIEGLQNVHGQSDSVEEARLREVLKKSKSAFTAFGAVLRLPH